MQYITIKRFKQKCMTGATVNLPYGTKLTEIQGVLYHNGLPICSDHSMVMREYFARDDDGRGMERGKLSQAIVDTLKLKKDETPEHRDKRWEAVWNDDICMKYRKSTQDDYFLWSIEFYNAPIEDLEYIARLVGVRKE